MSDDAAVAGSARDRLLRRIRDQQRQGRFPGATVEHPGAFSWRSVAHDAHALEQQFTRELSALGGFVYQVSTAADVVSIVEDVRTKANLPSSMLAWTEDQLPMPGVLDALRASGVSIDAGPVPAEGPSRETRLFEMERASLGLTGAVAAIADCGAIVVASGPGRSRMASLLPPVHFALVSREALYPSAASFLAANAPLVAASSNLVFITGPSRTADIEMTLTRGVHGPKEIHVLLVTHAPGSGL